MALLPFQDRGRARFDRFAYGFRREHAEQDGCPTHEQRHESDAVVVVNPHGRSLSLALLELEGRFLAVGRFDRDVGDARPFHLLRSDDNFALPGP